MNSQYFNSDFFLRILTLQLTIQCYVSQLSIFVLRIARNKVCIVRYDFRISRNNQNCEIKRRNYPFYLFILWLPKCMLRHFSTITYLSFFSLTYTQKKLPSHLHMLQWAVISDCTPKLWHLWEEIAIKSPWDDLLTFIFRYNCLRNSMVLI